MEAKTRNRLALAWLIAAKVLGIAGLIVGAIYSRTLGGLLLLSDGLLLVAAVVLVLLGAKREKVVEQDQKEVLRQMVREGTLEQYLRDISRDDERSPAGE